jgi:hypothetical protein
MRRWVIAVLAGVLWCPAVVRAAAIAYISEINTVAGSNDQGTFPEYVEVSFGSTSPTIELVVVDASADRYGRVLQTVNFTPVTNTAKVAYYGTWSASSPPSSQRVSVSSSLNLSRLIGSARTLVLYDAVKPFSIGQTLTTTQLHTGVLDAVTVYSSIMPAVSFGSGEMFQLDYGQIAVRERDGLNLLTTFAVGTLADDPYIGGLMMMNPGYINLQMAAPPPPPSSTGDSSGSGNTGPVTADPSPAVPEPSTLLLVAPMVVMLRVRRN